MWLSDEGDLLVDRVHRHPAEAVSEDLTWPKLSKATLNESARHARLAVGLPRRQRRQQSAPVAGRPAERLPAPGLGQDARKRALAFSVTWYLGTLSFGTFLILVVTGILLMLYYHPSVPQAYADMKDLQFVVSAGVFLRNLHRWSAHAMVLLVFAHMFKVFYRGAYRTPREFNWVIGVVLLIVTLLLSYTGYLLPWDQLALLGHHGRLEHHVRRAGAGPEDPLPHAGRQHRERQRAAALLRAALRDSAADGDSVHRHSLLAHPQGRRPVHRASKESHE